MRGQSYLSGSARQRFEAPVRILAARLAAASMHAGTMDVFVKSSGDQSCPINTRICDIVRRGIVAYGPDE